MIKIKVQYHKENMGRFIVALAMFVFSLYILKYAIEIQDMSYGMLALLITLLIPSKKVNKNV